MSVMDDSGETGSLLVFSPSVCELSDWPEGLLFARRLRLAIILLLVRGVPGEGGAGDFAFRAAVISVCSAAIFCLNCFVSSVSLFSIFCMCSLSSASSDFSISVTTVLIVCSKSFLGGWVLLFWRRDFVFIRSSICLRICWFSRVRCAICSFCLVESLIRSGYVSWENLREGGLVDGHELVVVI